MATFYGTPAVTSLRPQYATSGEFNELKLGVKVGDLGAGVLDTYLQRATAAIDEFMGRDFSPGDAIHESLYSTNSGNGDVRIGRDGTVSIYPNERFPVNSVASIGWVVKSGAGGLWHAPASAAPQSVASGDITVQKDTYGDGYRIKIWQDFSRLRGNQYLETAGYPAGTPEVQSSGETLTVTFDLPRAAVEGQGVYLHAELSTRIRQEFRA